MVKGKYCTGEGECNFFSVMHDFEIPLSRYSKIVIP